MHARPSRPAVRLLALPGARALVALAALPSLLGGCYSARPVRDVAAVAPGQRVEVLLTPDGTAALTGVLGPQVERVTGDLVSATRDTLRLALVRTTRQDDRESAWQRQELALARTYVAETQARQLSRTRSWLAAAAIVIGAVALAGFLTAGDQTGSPGGIVEPPN